MAVAAASYQEALEITPPNLQPDLAVSPTRPSSRNADSIRHGSIQSVASVSKMPHFRASALPMDTARVFITTVTKGPSKFTVQVKSKETEKGLEEIRELLNKVDLKPIAKPANGMPCIAIANSDVICSFFNL